VLVEGRRGVASPAPAKDEFVEIAAQVGPAQAMQHPERPAFEVREHPVDPFQHNVGGHRPDDLRLVAAPGQPGISAPTAIASQPSSTAVFIPVSLVSASGEVAVLFTVLLTPGLNTPSLRLEGSSPPHQLDFNIDPDIPIAKLPGIS